MPVENSAAGKRPKISGLHNGAVEILAVSVAGAGTLNPVSAKRVWLTEATVRGVTLPLRAGK